MKRLFLAILLCWLIVPLNTFAAASPLVISEFMASNSRTLADEDGEFSDWVELHNTGPSAVNLDGWFLTDDPAALTKWRLPATNLNARSYMVVFASNKDRRIPGMPLHTNFKLSSNGEYLALVQPDGVTIASDYAPAFPPQAADVSFGLDTGLRIATVLGSNATGRLLVPADDSLATNWVARAYNDENWLTAISGVGYSAGALATLGVPGLTSNLVGYWKFDETNGFTAADSSGRANSGALVNFPTDNSQWLAGRNDGALRFRGSPANDFVRVANYPKATNGLTVAAWVWADGRPTWASIAKNWGAALAGQFHFGLRDTGGDLDIFIGLCT